MKKKLLVTASFVGVAMLGLIIAACGAGKGPSTSEPPNEVHVLLNEWVITGAHGENLDVLPVGEAIVEVHNEGNTYHRLAVWRGGNVVGDEVQGGTLVAKTDLIAPGDVTSLRVTFEPGEYIFTCPISGHTQLGMHAESTAQVSVQGDGQMDGSEDHHH